MKHLRFLWVFLFVAGAAYAAEQAVEFGGGKGDSAYFSYDDSTHTLKVRSVVTTTPTATPTNTPTPTATATP